MYDQLRGRALPVPDAVRFGIGVADALRHVHEQESVYGSLAPDGIILTGDGVELAPAQRRTFVSPYAAPEQLQGRFDDPRSDIFALGAVLYEMLAGRKAFESRNSDDLRAAILDREPRQLDDVPQHLARLVNACLEKRPERRLQRAQLVVAQLKLISSSLRARRTPIPTARVVPIAPPRSTESNGRLRVEPPEPPAEPVLIEEETEAVASAPPAKQRRPCPRCKAIDVRPSRPKSSFEEALAGVGVKFSRCHRCYYRFMQVAFLSVSLET